METRCNNNRPILSISVFYCMELICLSTHRVTSVSRRSKIKNWFMSTEGHHNIFDHPEWIRFLLCSTATWGGKAGLTSVRRSPYVWQPVWRPLLTVPPPASADTERVNTDILAKTSNSEGLNYSALALNFSAPRLDSVDIADSSWKLLKLNFGIP